MYNKDKWNVDLTGFEVKSSKYMFHDFIEMKHKSSLFVPITICSGTEDVLNVFQDTVLCVAGLTINDNMVISILVDVNFGHRRYAYSNMTNDDYTSLISGRIGAVNDIQAKSDMYVIEYNIYGISVRWYKLPFLPDQYLSTNAQSLIWNNLTS